MVPDALDERIEVTRREVAELSERLAAAQLRLAAYEESARLRPKDQAVTAAQAKLLSAASTVLSKRGGRQPGAISRRWQVILKLIAKHYPQGANPTEIASFGPHAELPNLKPKDAKHQADKYVEIGYMERAADDRYRVTETACSRYKLQIANEDGDNADIIDQVDIEPLPYEGAATDSQSVAAPDLLSAERV